MPIEKDVSTFVFAAGDKYDRGTGACGLVQDSNRWKNGQRRNMPPGDPVPASELDGFRIEREKAIYREQAKASGKPDKILDKIADGKLEKYFGDFCLVEQAFIKDPDRKVSQLLADAGKGTGAPITVRSFVRFQVGEGMEKRSDDLAAEVAKQLGQG